jgi:hypothetical protein
MYTERSQASNLIQFSVYSNNANVFCFLSYFPLLHPATKAVFVISLLLTNTVSPVQACLMPILYSYDWRGFVGVKKKTSLGLLAFNPLCYTVCATSRLPISDIVN